MPSPQPLCAGDAPQSRSPRPGSLKKLPEVVARAERDGDGIGLLGAGFLIFGWFEVGFLTGKGTR